MIMEYILLGFLIVLIIICLIVVTGISYTLYEIDNGKEFTIKKETIEAEPHDDFVFVRDPYLVDSMENWDVGLLWSIDKDICKVGFVDEFDSSIKYYDIKKEDIGLLWSINKNICKVGLVDEFDSSIKYYDIKKEDIRFDVLDAYNSNKLNVYQLWQLECLEDELEKRRIEKRRIEKRRIEK